MLIKINSYDSDLDKIGIPSGRESEFEEEKIIKQRIMVWVGSTVIITWQ